MKKNKMIVTEDELEYFKSLEAQKLGLRRAVGENMKELIDLWKRLHKKYKLDPKRFYVLNLEAKELRIIGEKHE